MDSIKNKIQLLLNLSGNNPNENEREQAMLMAQQLLAKHNLSMRDLHVKGQVGEQSIGKHKKWLETLALAVSKLYYCSIYHSRKENSIILVGTEENLGVAVDIYNWLSAAISKEAKQAFRSNYRYPEGMTAEKMRNSFKLGASSNVYQRALTMMEREKIEAPNAGNQLMVIRNELQAANDEFLATKDLVLKNNRSSTVIGEAYSAGKDFANNLNLGKQIAGKATLTITQRS